MSITLHRATKRGLHGPMTFKVRLGHIREPRVDLNAFLVMCFWWRRAR
jgi:hypothetical protein